MNPAFNKTRPRLPSVLSIFGPIERYQVEMDKRGPFLGDSVAALEPLDAYLAHLLVNVHPGEPSIVDLAAEATAGASTILGLLHPRQPHVRAIGGPPSSESHAYRNLVEAFLQRQEKDRSFLQWLPDGEPTAERRGEIDVIVFVTASKPGVDAVVERWLNHLPSAIVFVFGLGPVGDCAALDALMQRFPTSSTRRLTLLRESAEALSFSRLGVIAERDNAMAEAALWRLRQLFTSNYSFLGLLRSATETAIRASESDRVVRESDDSFLEWTHEINQLKKAAQHAHENAQAAQELRVVKSQISYRLSEQFRRWRKQLAPNPSRRYRLLQLLRRVAQIIRREGIFGLYHRLVRRCRRRNA